ncbi:MAG: hypothetical protein J6D12_01005, partial [Peptostreptococcaceae bacterium]|nr:hypothetical protein [Peptostreptococcaceae bacterium]
MIIKAVFDYENDFDYIYCPEKNISIDKSQIKDRFINWINYTEEDHPFWCYENGELMGKCYRGDAIVYWLNKYILIDKESRDKSELIEVCSCKN